MNKTEEAVEVFAKGYNCSQAVFSTFSSATGIDRETAMKLACGFGGGIGRQAETCGAVTGAVMALSLLQASPEPTSEAKSQMYALVQRFCQEFRNQNGSTMCRELLGYDISTDEGRRQASEAGLFKSRCPEYVRGATAIVERLLAERAK